MFIAEMYPVRIMPVDVSGSPGAESKNILNFLYSDKKTSQLKEEKTVKQADPLTPPKKKNDHKEGDLYTCRKSLGTVFKEETASRKNPLSHWSIHWKSLGFSLHSRLVRFSEYRHFKAKAKS